MRAEITTVGELVAALAAFPPQTRVQLAVAPGYPQAATIGVIACSPDDAEGDGCPPATEERMVWISESTPLGYLPEIARVAPSAKAGHERHRQATSTNKAGR